MTSTLYIRLEKPSRDACASTAGGSAFSSEVRTCAPSAWREPLRSCMPRRTTASRSTGARTPTGSGAAMMVMSLPACPARAAVRTETGTHARSSRPSTSCPGLEEAAERARRPRRGRRR